MTSCLKHIKHACRFETVVLFLHNFSHVVFRRSKPRRHVILFCRHFPIIKTAKILEHVLNSMFVINKYKIERPVVRVLPNFSDAQ